MAEAPSITLDWLNGPDIARLAISDKEILAAVEGGLEAQGSGAAVIEPRVHLTADPAFKGHFNVLRGYVAPLQASPGSRSSAITSTTTSTACPRRWRCSTCSTHNRRTQGHHRCHRHHRHAHRRADRARRPPPGAQGLQSARPCGREGHGLLERAPARSFLRF